MIEAVRGLLESLKLFLLLMAGAFLLLGGLGIVMLSAWLELRKWKRSGNGVGNRK